MDLFLNKTKLLALSILILFSAPYLLTPLFSFPAEQVWMDEIKLLKTAVCLSLIFYWHFYRQSSITDVGVYSRKLVVYILLLQVCESLVIYFVPALLELVASLNLLLSALLLSLWHKKFIGKRKSDFLVIFIFAFVLLALLLFSINGQSFEFFLSASIAGCVGAGGLFSVGLMRLQYKFRNLIGQDLLPFIILFTSYLALSSTDRLWFELGVAVFDVLFIIILISVVFRLNRISSKDSQLFSAGLETAKDAYYCGNLEGNCHYINPAYRALFSIDENVLISDIKHPFYTHPIQQSVETELKENGHWKGETVFMDVSQGLRPVYVEAQIMEINGEKYQQAWFRDLGERVKFKQQENLMLEKLERLSFNLIEKQEEERRFFAKELHDEIGQGLTLLKIQQQLPEPDKDLITTVLAELIDKVRNLSLNLRPSILDDMGLAIALEWLVDRQKKFSQLDLLCDVDGAIPRLDEKIEISVFRIVQEAFTNIHKYAHANKVIVRAKLLDNFLHVVVEDDGVGFDVDTKISKAVRGQSLGLLGIQERIYLINGQVNINSSPEKGTKIELKVPCGNSIQKPASEGVQV